MALTTGDFQLHSPKRISRNQIQANFNCWLGLRWIRSIRIEKFSNCKKFSKLDPRKNFNNFIRVISKRLLLRLKSNNVLNFIHQLKVHSTNSLILTQHPLVIFSHFSNDDEFVSFSSSMFEKNF